MQEQNTDGAHHRGLTDAEWNSDKLTSQLGMTMRVNPDADDDKVIEFIFWAVNAGAD